MSGSASQSRARRRASRRNLRIRNPISCSRKKAIASADAPPEGSNFKHLTIAPDGTLIVKNQTRATPCDIQGTLAAFQCPGGAAASPGSTILGINPDSFEIYDSISVPENAVTPHTIAMHDGKIVIYVPTIAKFHRFIWNPETKKLSKDVNWEVANYLAKGQTSGDAPGILGDWVVVQVNGLPSKVASSIVAISQSDPTTITRGYPFGTDLPTGTSWAPPKAAVDEDNSMVFSADQNMMKIGALTHTQQKLETASLDRVLEAAEKASRWQKGAPNVRGATRGDLDGRDTRKPCTLGARIKAGAKAAPKSEKVA